MIREIEDVETLRIDELWSGNIIIDLFTTWCAPCRLLKLILEEVSNEYQTVSFMAIDVDKNRKIALERNVTMVPTLLFISQGIEVFRIEGICSKEEITKSIEQFLLTDR